MNENHELPKAIGIKTFETDFFRVVGSKDWQPSLSVGPFLPITSGGEGSVPYRMAYVRGSTIVNDSQGFVLI